MSNPTPEQQPPAAPQYDRSDWNKPLPEIIPPPTYAPAFFASGIVLLVWGPLTIWFVSLVGLAFILCSLAAWIRAIRKDWRINK